jgi:hypothetical protein
MLCLCLKESKWFEHHLERRAPTHMLSAGALRPRGMLGSGYHSEPEPSVVCAAGVRNILQQ